MSLAGIPADVWQLILQHLEILAVCMFGSASRAAASQAFSCEQMWTLVRLPRKSEAHVLGILRLGASLGAPLVQHLDATATPLLEDASLFAAAALMPLLQRINLNGCRRVQSATVALAQTCPRLTAMQCAGCPRLSDREIVGITHHAASRLVHLDLSSCSSRVGDVSARALGLCTALRELRLSNCKQLTDSGAISMFVGAGHLANALGGGQGAGSGGGGGDGIDVLAQNEHAGVAGVEGVERAASGLGGGMLTCLGLSACEKITDAALEALGGQCRQLLHLDLSLSKNFSAHMIARVLHSTCHLRSLDCVGVDHLTGV